MHTLSIATTCRAEEALTKRSPSAHPSPPSKAPLTSRIYLRLSRGVDRNTRKIRLIVAGPNVAGRFGADKAPVLFARAALLTGRTVAGSQEAKGQAKRFNCRRVYGAGGEGLAGRGRVGHRLKAISPHAHGEKAEDAKALQESGTRRDSRERQA